MYSFGEFFLALLVDFIVLFVFGSALFFLFDFVLKVYHKKFKKEDDNNETSL